MKKKRDEIAEQTFLSMERSVFSEERTMLAYIQTELALLGVLFIVWRFYFVEQWWSLPLASVVGIIFLIVIIIEIVKIGKLRKIRFDLKAQHKWV